MSETAYLNSHTAGLQCM